MKFFTLLFSLIVFSTITSISCSKNPFKVLGLPETASDDQIKQKFRELSKKYHPDKNPDEKAREFYSEITNAYQTLSDPASRRKYEQEQDNQKYANTFTGGGGGGWGYYGGGYSTQTKQANHKKKWNEAFMKKHNQSYQTYFNTKKSNYVNSGGSSILGWIKNKIVSIFSFGFTEIIIYGFIIYIVIKIFGSFIHVQMGQT